MPTYLADKGLKTFADIARFEKELGAKIYGIEPGSGANTQIKAMISKNQFGLGKFQLVESSEAGMLAAVDRAVRRKEAVVFFGWAPHPMNVNVQMTYLTGSEDALGPNEGIGDRLDRHRAEVRRAMPEHRPSAEQPDVHRRRREPDDAAAAGSQGRFRIGQAMAERSPARQAALA